MKPFAVVPQGTLILARPVQSDLQTGQGELILVREDAVLIAKGDLVVALRRSHDRGRLQAKKSIAEKARRMIERLSRGD